MVMREDISNHIKSFSMEYNRHPLAEIMKPTIKQFNEIENKRHKLSYEVISNFASDFFALRDLKRLKPLLEEYEYMMEYRKIIYSYSYYFYFWVNNNFSKNWYFKSIADKIYF